MLRAVAVHLIDWYRTEISVHTVRRCRFEPSCSAYARQALLRHGLGHGLRLTRARLDRCTMHHPGGFDPVPPRGQGPQHPEGGQMSRLNDILKKLIEAAVDWVQKCIPAYDPAAWNDGNGIQFNNNCYNYACDTRTDTFAQPGRGSGNQYNALDCGEVTKGAKSDGLVPTDCDQGCGCDDCAHQVALVVAPGWDFHWYRKGPDGMWSHKPGGTKATNLDNSGNPITDPRTADRGPYTVFCGCFCVNKSAITIN